MTALAKGRNTPMKDGDLISIPVAANAVIYEGALVVTNGGYLQPGSVATTLVYQGRAEQAADNTGGSNGDLSVLVRRNKAFKYANDGTITQADVGKTAYIVDDQTVADNSGTNTRSACGVIIEVEADGVWIQ